jgi:hypothetical protein
MEGVIGFIAFCAAVFGIFYLHFTTRHKERLALIEKGADASLFNTGKEGRFSISWNKVTLKFGMFLMGIALGILTGSLIDSADLMPEAPGYFSMVFFFGGLSLVLFYVFDRKGN